MSHISIKECAALALSPSSPFKLKKPNTHPHTFVSQGNRGVIFDLSFVARWEGTLVDPKGESCGTGDGEVVVTDLDQDCFSLSGGEGRLELPLKIRPSEDGGEKDAQLTSLFVAHGSALLRAKLAEFVAELKAQE